MGNIKREREILELLKTTGYATVDYLAAKLFASPSSIRRDLTHLENQGYVKRSYGGVTLLSQQAGLAPFALRRQEDRKEKIQIVRNAVQLIRPESTVFFDSSTTALHFAFLVKPEWNITAYTNNLHLAHLLASKHIKTYSAGGLVSDRDYVITTGSYALDMLKNIYVDQMFFTCTALSDTGTITDVNESETQVRKLMLEQSGERIFLCPHKRYNRISQHAVTRLDSLEYVVSDQPLPTAFRNRFPDIEFINSKEKEADNF